MKNTPMAIVIHTVVEKSSQNMTPKTCGVEIKGTKRKVANGLVNLRLPRPKKRISINLITKWWKWSRSGRSAGFPSLQRRQIAKPVSATGQKKTNNILNELIAGFCTVKIMADHTSK